MNRKRLYLFGGLLALGSLCPNLATAQRNLAQIPPTDPEIERATFEVAEGFEVSLFAADPALAKPIQMNFDAAGRLWVASSSVYPQIEPGAVANDKILILEDRDGDGKSDQTHVFAEGLLIPTGVEPGHGGAYVADSTELIHLADTDGDGKADRRRVVLAGFGTEDTHHIIHTFRWGHDGSLFFNQSIYIHSHVETPHGVRRLGGGGIWQFRPESQQLEVLCKGMWNGWGHHFDRFGQSFGTDGAGGEGIHWFVPGAIYSGFPNTKRQLFGMNPKHPKYCGAEILSGRHLPDAYQGNIITNDFRANRVCRFSLTEDGTGSGYISKQEPDLIRSRHVAFRPIDVKMGPDGAIYIADWYNPIIQHGEVDFRDPRRDHVHGRIWRVTAKGRPLVDRPKLVGASTAELVAQLSSPENWTRHFARRVLAERPAKEVVPAVNAWLAKLDPNAADVEQLRLEGFWTLQTMNQPSAELVGQLAKSPDGRVRAAAIRAVATNYNRFPQSWELLTAAVKDAHPRVRLEAVRGLASTAKPEALPAVLAALDLPLDTSLEYALWMSVNDLSPQWLPLFREGKLELGSDPRKLEYALTAVASPEVLGGLVQLLKQPGLPADREARLWPLVASLGGGKELRAVFDRLQAAGTAPELQVTLLNGLTAASRQRKQRPAGDLNGLTKLLESNSEPVQLATLELAGAWKLAAARADLQTRAMNDKASPAVQRAALVSLGELGGPETMATLQKLTAADRPLNQRMQAIGVWVPLDLPGAAKQAGDILTGLDPAQSDPAELFRIFLQQKNGPETLAGVLKDRTLPADVAKLGLRVCSTVTPEPKALTDALRTAGKLGGPPQPPTPEQVAQWTDEVRRTGNAARGEAIFRRNELSCLKCHGVGGAGGQVGPDLSSIGATAQLDYLVESLLDPNKAIKENFHAIVVETSDGKSFTGIKVRQDNQVLVLRDANDKEVSVPVADIEAQGVGKSLMPAGLIEPLTRTEVVDLIRFLSELGKVGPYSIDRVARARRWSLLEPTNDAKILLRNNGAQLGTLATDPRLQWNSVYSRVDGTLPKSEQRNLRINETEANVAVLRCDVQVAAAGKFELVVPTAEGVSLWVDGKSVPVAKSIPLDLPVGTHTLVWAVQPRDFALEVREVAGSGARVQFVLGK